MLQCLCGPQRHAIYAMLYDDKTLSSQNAREGIEALIEMWIDHNIMRRRCEICDKDVVQFHYDDQLTRSQNWDEALAESKEMERQQILTRDAVMAMRKGDKN